MMVLGEITTSAKVDYVQIVKKTLETIGYEDEENGKTICILIKMSYSVYITLIQQLTIAHAM